MGLPDVQSAMGRWRSSPGVSEVKRHHFADCRECLSGRICEDSDAHPSNDMGDPVLIERYRRYLSYGHGRFFAFMLAPPPEWFFLAICGVVGFYVGLWFWELVR